MREALRRFLLVVIIVCCVSIVIAVGYAMGQPVPPEAPAGATNFEAYVALMQSLPHWLFEITLEIITGIVVFPLGRWVWERQVKAHDEQFHPESKHKHEI